jgi:hypothetical protein
MTRDDLRDVLTEVLRDNRDWLRELVQEALESAAHDEAMREAEYRDALVDPRRAFPVAEGRA